MRASALRGALKVMNTLRGKKVCYLTVKLLELVDECFSLKGSILKVMNSLRGKKVCYLAVELLELVD